MSTMDDAAPAPGGRPRVGAAEIRDAIYDISEAAATVQDLGALYRRIHQIVATLMPAHNFYIALLDTSGERVGFPCFVDERDHVPSPDFRPMGDGLTEYIIRGRKPFFFGPGEQKEYRDRGLFQILGDSYTKADLDVLSYVSRQVASAIYRKRTHDMLEESNRRLDTLVNNLPGSVFRRAIDELWTMAYLSGGAKELTGYAAADFIDNTRHSFASIVLAEDRAPVQNVIAEALAERRAYSASCRIRAATGAVRWVFERSSRVFLERALVALEGFITDVTEARQAEAERASLAEQLRQAQKMESVGLLAGGVAHDLNNLLMPILGYADVLMESAPAGTSQREMLGQIQQAAGRARDLVRQLLAFSRRQVLLNLAVNAQDAMGAASPARPLLRIALEGSADTIVLTFGDNGAGMSPDALSHAFEPFFTTKAPGKGTGLGLSTVYGIITQHGGQITIASLPGQGTEFRIVLPRAERPAASGPEARPDAIPATRGSETILFAEDEDAVRELSSTTLRRAGYRVIACSGGEEALAMARRHEGRIHMLVTDVIMAGMNGKDLAEALLRERPDTPVLYTSGYTDDVIARHEVFRPGTHFMPKPYTPRELAARVRSVIDGRP